MPEENAFNGSDTSGSPLVKGSPNPNDLGGATGKGPTSSAPQIDPAQYAELEKTLGRQGAELGEFRKFFADIDPLLKKLDSSPEIVQAILEGSITPDLAKAAMEGKISISDAQVVSKAHEEVKKELGKDYKGASPEEVTKLVSEKAEEIRGEFAEKLKQRDDLADFESSVNDFIARTSDFPKYAKEIDKWLDDHDVTDIGVAYYAVKGELSEKEAKKQADIEKAEAEKNGALNMGGGAGQATHIRGDSSGIVDSLIASKSNPNVF